MLVGYGVGTGNDLYLRLLARHIGKSFPASHHVAENMPGAGGIVDVQHLYNVAARDGTVLATPHAACDRAALRQCEARYDALEARLARQHQPRCRDLHHLGKSGIASIRMPSGARSRSLDRRIRRDNYFPKLLNAVLRTLFKTVLGYPDSGASALPWSAASLDGYCSFTWAAIKSARPNWLTDSRSMSSAAQHGQASRAAGRAIGRRSCARRGVGQIFHAGLGAQKMGRPVTTTPGVPPERHAARRRPSTPPCAIGLPGRR